MTTEIYTNTPETQDAVLEQALAEYLSARHANATLDIQDWLKRYPHHVHILQDFLNDDDSMHSAFQGFRLHRPELDLKTPARFLGDYELLREIGGNMGVVYLARQISLPREVGVKLLARAGAFYTQRFRQEAEAMARLQHPHIVRILEVSRENAQPYFSMEWCPGGTLTDRISRTVTDSRLAADILRRVAMAVHFAHQRGILHRDLKPANILFDDTDLPRVADFGLALSIQEAEGQTGQIAGTPAYMAPEQVAGEVTTATDIYGLGAVLYECLTGKAPIRGNTVAEILEKVERRDITSPMLAQPGVDEDLSAIAMKCLQKNPTDRYATAGELAEDLNRFLNGQPTQARPLHSFGRLRLLLKNGPSLKEIQNLGTGLIAQAAFVCLSNWVTWLLLQHQAPEPFIWLSLFVSYVPFFAFIWHERWLTRHKYDATRQYLLALWCGHALACVVLFLGMRLFLADVTLAFHGAYVACGAVNTLAFIVLGSIFSGRFFLGGLLWALATPIMAVAFPHAAILYAVLMAASSLSSGLLMKSVSTARETP